jgi:hypothetical protein
MGTLPWVRVRSPPIGAFRTCSSVVESLPLITGWSVVRVHPRPPGLVDLRDGSAELITPVDGSTPSVHTIH